MLSTIYSYACVVWLVMISLIIMINNNNLLQNSWLYLLVHWSLLWLNENNEPRVAFTATYSRQNFSGLSWMVKRYYIQDCPENFRGNTETRTIASDFIWSSIKRSLTRREKKRHIRHVSDGSWLFTSC